VAFFINDRFPEDMRRFKRIKISSPIEYRFLNDNRYQNTLICDISEGGICFLADGPVPLGAYVYFRVKLKNRPQPIFGIARIVWAAQEPYSMQHRVGLEFTEIGSISKADICTLIQEQKSSCYSS
jgi:c-di-GMP-binding flagellar brake protein YcgR